MTEAETSEPLWVLLAEDDVGIAGDLETMLVQDGFRVVRAAKAIEAINKLRLQRFDCVLLDMVLENGSGEEVIKFTRTERKNANFEVPIVVMSGHLDADLVKKIGFQVNGILVKPFDAATLIAKLKEAIQLAG